MSHQANQMNHLYLYTYSKCVVFRLDVMGLTGSCYFTTEDEMRRRLRRSCSFYYL